jgi:hypothetical protein
MIKVIHLDDSGAEMATVEIDDFTIETVYAGIADLLRRATLTTPPTSSTPGLSRQERQRREKILTRIHS